MLLPLCTDYILSAGELIETRQNKTGQRLHTENNSWPTPLQHLGSLCVNAMVSLTDYTAENGATLVIAGSHLWPKARFPDPEEVVPTEMPAGSVALFIGETLHVGGTSIVDSIRRGLSISFCVGWLRPVENHYLNLTMDQIKAMSKRAQQILAWDAYDGTPRGNDVLSYYEMGKFQDLFS